MVRAFTAALVVVAAANLPASATGLRRGHTIPTRWMPLVLVRPFLQVGLWARAMFNRRIIWRGNLRWLGRKALM